MSGCVLGIPAPQCVPGKPGTAEFVGVWCDVESALNGWFRRIITAGNSSPATVLALLEGWECG